MFRLPRDIAIGLVLICGLAVGLISGNWLRKADLAVYDTQMRWLRAHAPSALTRDVVLIGLDEVAFEALPEPAALWHRYLAALFDGLAQARPAAVGLAMPLPVRSYDFLVKGIDAPLIEALKRLRAAAPLVVGQTLGVNRQARPIAAELRAAAGAQAPVSLLLCEDPDGLVRRIEQDRCAGIDHATPFALAMAGALGRAGPPAGLIDYSVGREMEYLPLKTVLDWIERGELGKLADRVQGHAVVVASLLPTEARHQLPVALAAWERGRRDVPDVVAHAQALRSMLGHGLIEEPPLVWSLLLAGLAALLWIGRNGWVKLLILVAAMAAIFGIALLALWHGYHLRAGGALTVAGLAFAARLAWDSAHHYHERQMLRSAFAGHVSPQVMRAILGGGMRPEGDGERCQATILFADIRDFTTRSEKAAPEAIIALLNRYYAEAAAAIHARGGAVDKFIGDGLMATFGVPQRLPASQRNALEAAQDLLIRLTRLNAELIAEGQEPLEIGIGIHAGEVLAGYVGSRKRRDFTVIGDPVNTAARLEGMSKTLGYPVICSREVAAAVGFAGGMVDLGSQPIKGRSDLQVWGWKPPLSASSNKGAP